MQIRIFLINQTRFFPYWTSGKILCERKVKRFLSELQNILNISFFLPDSYFSGQSNKLLFILNFRQESFFLPCQMTLVWSIGNFKSLEVLSRFLFFSLISQDSFYLELQARIFLSFLSKESCLTYRIEKNLLWPVKKNKNLDRTMSRSSTSVVSVCTENLQVEYDHCDIWYNNKLWCR